MQRIIYAAKKNNLVPGIMVLVLIMVLGYKAYSLKIESTLRKTALKIVTVHASYNKFLRDHRSSPNFLPKKIEFTDVNFDDRLAVIDASNIDDLARFWKELLSTIKASEFLKQFESREEKLSNYISLGKFGEDLDLIFWTNNIEQPSYKLTFGILIKGQYGVELDKLIDDGSPVSGHMKLQRILDKSKISEQNDKCAQVNLPKLTRKNLVDCNYIYLF